MNAATSDRFGRWARGLGLVAVVALAWSVFVPVGFSWAAILAGGLIGSALATVAVVRSRRAPTLAQVIASAETEPAVGPGERT